MRQHFYLFNNQDNTVQLIYTKLVPRIVWKTELSSKEIGDAYGCVSDNGISDWWPRPEPQQGPNLNELKPPSLGSIIRR